MSQNLTKEKLKKFLTTKFLIEFNKDITEETDLFEEGLIDSFNYVELVSFIEQEFKVQIGDDELVSDVLNSVSSILEWLRSKSE